MANKIKFTMNNVPANLAEMYVTITDTGSPRATLYQGTVPVESSEVEILLGDVGTPGQEVIVHTDNYSASKGITAFIGTMGGSIIEKLKTLAGFKFQSNGTDNYIDLGFIPGTTTDVAFQVSFLDTDGTQLSGSQTFSIGTTDGVLTAVMNGTATQYSELGTDSVGIGILSDGIAYVDGIAQGAATTLTASTLNMLAMASNSSAGAVNFCNAIWERISWNIGNTQYYIDFNEGSGNIVKDNFGTSYTIQGTVSDSQWINYQRPRRVILDFDMESDCDDVGAARVAMWAERMGYIDIVAAIMSNKRSGLALAASLDAVLTFDGRPELAIGSNRGASPAPGVYPYTPTLLTYPHNLTEEDNDVEDSNDTYRRAIQSAIDDGVTLDIITVGTLRGYAELLRCEADDRFASGLSLINAGVGRVFTMGGDYLTGAEYNFNASNQIGYSTYYVLANNPKPHHFHGADIGNLVTTGGGLKTVYPTAGTDIVRDAYKAHGSESGRRSWDPVTVLCAAYPDPLVTGTVRVRGTNVASTSGSNTFTESPTGNHSYYRLKKTGYLQAILNSILEKTSWPEAREGIGEFSIPRIATVLKIAVGTCAEAAPADTVVTTFTMTDLSNPSTTVDFTPGTNLSGYYYISGNTVCLTAAGETFVATGGNELPNIYLTASTGARAMGRVRTIGAGAYARSYTALSAAGYQLLNKPIRLKESWLIKFKLRNVGTNTIIVFNGPTGYTTPSTATLNLSLTSTSLTFHTGTYGSRLTVTLDGTSTQDITLEFNGSGYVGITANAATGSKNFGFPSLYIASIFASSSSTTGVGAYLEGPLTIDRIANRADYPSGTAAFYMDENGPSNGYKYYNADDDTKSTWAVGTGNNATKTSQTEPTYF
jgi:hypothetical protein